MVVTKTDRALLLVVIACLVILGSSRTSVGQSEDRTAAVVERPMDVDVEVQLHILVASNTPDSGKMPARLEAVAKELRPILPFTNYRLGASFLGRGKNARPWSVKGVGRSLLVTPALESSVLPTFYEISAGMLNLKTDGAGRAVVHVTGFRFGLRIPLQTGSFHAKEGGASTPTINYEPIGITTDVSMREGEFVVVGTLDAGRPNETLVLVLVASRASAR